MKKILVLGAGSGIAQSFARQELLEGSKLFLAARTPGKLDELMNWAAKQGQADHVRLASFDAKLTNPKLLINEAVSFLKDIDIVLVAFGSYRDQLLCQENTEVAMQELEDNFLWQVRWLTQLVPFFEQRAGGTIAVISSVAGDRGRQSNYVYGAAKAGLNVFLEGMRHRLWKSGVKVLTIKPGFVNTPMTAKLEKNFLFASPETVANDIRKACRAERREIYTPFFWRWILLLVRNTPGFIFYRTKL